MPTRTTRSRRAKRRTAKRAGGWRRAKRGAPQRKRKATVIREPWRTHGDGSKLLAFDFSSSCTGWAYFESNILRNSGKHRMEGKSHSEKLSNFLTWVLSLVRDVEPTSIAFEAPFQGRHAHAYGVLSMYKAVLLLAHWETLGTTFPDYNQLPAHMIKKVLGVTKAAGKTTTERHDANKRAVIKVINTLYGTAFKFADPGGRKLTDDDIADAVAVGHVWYVLHESNQKAVAKEDA